MPKNQTAPMSPESILLVFSVIKLQRVKAEFASSVTVPDEKKYFAELVTVPELSHSPTVSVEPAMELVVTSVHKSVESVPGAGFTHLVNRASAIDVAVLVPVL